MRALYASFYFFHTLRHEFQNPRLLAVYGSRRKGGGGNNFNEEGHFFKEAVLYIDFDYTQCNIPDHATSNFKINSLRDKLRDMLHRVTVPKKKHFYSLFQVQRFIRCSER